MSGLHIFGVQFFNGLKTQYALTSSDMEVFLRALRSQRYPLDGKDYKKPPKIYMKYWNKIRHGPVPTAFFEDNYIHETKKPDNGKNQKEVMLDGKEVVKNTGDQNRFGNNKPEANPNIDIGEYEGNNKDNKMEDGKAKVWQVHENKENEDRKMTPGEKREKLMQGTLVGEIKGLTSNKRAKVELARCGTCRGCARDDCKLCNACRCGEPCLRRVSDRHSTLEPPYQMDLRSTIRLTITTVLPNVLSKPAYNRIAGMCGRDRNNKHKPITASTPGMVLCFQ